MNPKDEWNWPRAFVWGMGWLALGVAIAAYEIAGKC